MAVRPDILIQNPDTSPVAIVEVKNRQHLSPDIATEYRRNLLVHGALLRAPYFLLLSQDVGFLWHNGKADCVDMPPSSEFPMGDVMARYLPHLMPQDRLRGEELRLVILQWLLDLAYGPPPNGEMPEQTLAHAGFLQAIRGATVTADSKQ